MRKLVRTADQLAQPCRSYHGVLVLAQEILESDKIAKSAFGGVAVHVGEELDRVAQLLSADAGLMELFRSGRCSQLLALLHELAMAIENELGCGKEHRDSARSRARADSAAKRLRRALDEPLDAPRGEHLQHSGPCSNALFNQAIHQRLQGIAVARIDRCAPFAELRQLNVEIADLSGCPHPNAQPIGQRQDSRGEGILEDSKCGTHAAERDAKIVQRFWIASQTRRGLVLPNLRKVSAQHAHSRFADGKRAIERGRPQVELGLDRNCGGMQEIDLARRRRRHHRARRSHRLKECAEVEITGLENAGLDCMKENGLGFRRTKGPLLERQTRERLPAVN